MSLMVNINNKSETKVRFDKENRVSQTKYNHNREPCPALKPKQVPEPQLIFFSSAMVRENRIRHAN